MSDSKINVDLTIRIFVCRYCGKVVVTGNDSEKPDKRTAFCSAECERKFWKKCVGSRKKRVQRAEEIYKKLRDRVEEICIDPS